MGEPVRDIVSDARNPCVHLHLLRQRAPGHHTLVRDDAAIVVMIRIIRHARSAESDDDYDGRQCTGVKQHATR
jgi:hypothetical protein